MVVVGRHLPGGRYQGYDTLKVVIPEEGAMFWTDYMLIPYSVENPLDAMTYMDYVYDPQVAGPDRGLQRLRLPGARREGDHREPAERSDRRRQPDGLPGRADGRAVQAVLPVPELLGLRSMEQHVRTDLRGG